MATPVLSTKLFVPPQRPQSVPRSRLIDRLSDGRAAGRKLTLISAPAGFGKTTVVSEWVADVKVREPDVRVAWVSLDEGDNDPSRFLSYLLAALERPPAPAASSPKSILTELINEIDQAPSSTILILDDFQTIEGATVRDVVSYLLEHQPSRLHVVIASRSDPLLPLARLRGRGELAELRAADMRFTADEAATFLNQMMGLGLSAVDIDALESRTEGWIAGLQLAALSMREHSEATAFIEAFTGSNRFVIDYLGEEVLQHQPDPVRSFLLRTALLERMCASLCDALTGRTDSGEMLNALERDNLFLVPLDDERRWYRYHHLFADVLRARSLRQDPDRVDDLRRLASTWHEVHDLPEEAIAYALSAGDFLRAAHLIERALPDMRRRRENNTLIAWLKLLPDDTTRRMPVLRAFSAWSMLVARNLDGADRRFSEVEESLKSDDGHDSLAGEELTKLPATIAAYRAAIAQARGDIDATETHARRALALSPQDDHLSRGSAGGLLGLAFWAKGDLESAVPTFRDAMASLEVAGYLTDAISGTVVMMDMLTVQGRRLAAGDAYERAVSLAAAAGEGRMIDLQPGRSEVSREENDLESATSILEAVPTPGAHAGVPENRHRWYVAMSRVKEAEGDLAAATVLLDQAERLFLPGYFPDARSISAMRTRIWIKQNRLADASAWAAENALSPDDDPSYMREFHHITLARLLIARYRSHQEAADIADATHLLDKLLDAADAAGRGGSVNEILVLQSLALAAQGRLLDAMAPLRKVLLLAEPEGYVRLFTDEGSPMAALLDEAGRRAILPQYVRRLRRSFAPSALAPGETAGASLSTRELAVLKMLATELTGPQIALELLVSLNTLRTHTRHIFEKLAVTTRPAAVRRAREQGLI